MSKVTMPEPVTYAHITDAGFIRMWSREKANLWAVTESIGRDPVALITTAQAEAYADARVREALESVGAGGVSGQRITQPPPDEVQSAWFAGIDAGREIERHNSQLDNSDLTY